MQTHTVTTPCRQTLWQHYADMHCDNTMKPHTGTTLCRNTLWQHYADTHYDNSMQTQSRWTSGLFVPNSPYGHCGRNNMKHTLQSSGAVWKSRWTSWPPCPQQSVRFLWVYSTEHVTLSELRSCVKVEMDVLSSTSLIVLTISADVKQHWTITLSKLRSYVEVEVDVLDVSNTPYGLCGRQATLKRNVFITLWLCNHSLDVKQH